MTESEIETILQHREFIRKNLKADTAQLALKYGSDPTYKLLLGQIMARQKIRKKLPEWYANLDLVLPTGLSLEQCSSEAAAKHKASLLKGKKLIDITGGLGIDTFYFSQSIGDTTYVEMNEELAAVAKHNLKALGCSIIVKGGDGLKELASSDADLVYADPYRRDDAQNKMVAFEDCLPDITKVLDELVKNRQTLIKASPMIDLSAAIEQLKYVSEIWITSVKNDCKEVLFLLDAQPQEILVKTFDLQHGSDNAFEFPFENRNLKADSGALAEHLYEPNASILKSGGQDFLASKIGLKKLHPNSNFFTSPEPLTQFPGKVFKIQEVLKPYDKRLKKKRFNVISRNFPDKANIIEQKLRLKPAAKDYLMATRLQDDSYRFIVCELLDRP